MKRQPALLAWVAAGVCVAALLVAAEDARAQNPVGFSPDVTANLGSAPPAIVGHQNLAYDNASNGVYPILPTTLPPNVDVSGYEQQGSDALLSFDTTVALPGLPAGMPAEPRDVVRFNGATLLFSFVFDGSANGVPPGARVDAVGLDAGANLLLSFDTTVSLPGVGTVDDEDLVRFAGGLFFLVYDGSANGIAAGLDLDGAALGPAPNQLLLSFDASGTAGGVVFDDEDVVAFDTSLLTYAMYFDGSLSDPDWRATDLVALPEPAGAAALLLGTALLAGLRRRAPRRRLRDPLPIRP